MRVISNQHLQYSKDYKTISESLSVSCPYLSHNETVSLQLPDCSADLTSLIPAPFASVPSVLAEKKQMNSSRSFLTGKTRIKIL